MALNFSWDNWIHVQRLKKYLTCSHNGDSLLVGEGGSLIFLVWETMSGVPLGTQFRAKSLYL